MTTVDVGKTQGADLRALLRRTRRISVLAAALLSVQLFGNLYEQLVTNVAAIANPQVGELVSELAPGSPLYYYLPWVPIGIVLVVVLAVRLPGWSAPTWVIRRVRAAVAALAVAVVAKTILITTVNPRFRDPAGDLTALRDWAITWAVGNAVAIVAVATAITLLLSWRAKVVDHALAA